MKAHLKTIAVLAIILFVILIIIFIASSIPEKYQESTVWTIIGLLSYWVLYKIVNEK